MILPLLLVLLAQNPPGHTASHPNHRTYKGGEVHEVETDGVTDGIVIWKNGTAQAIHNGVLGKWYPKTFAKDGKVKYQNNDKNLVLIEPVNPAVVNDLGPPTIIDDYVYVSPQLVSYWGGMTSAINQVHLAEDAMNDAFAHSGVNAIQRVVGIAQYDVNEVTGGTDQANWDATFHAYATRYAQGGFAALRTSTGFDSITLMIKNGTQCGQSYVFSSSFPLTMVRGDCATGNMTYAHEHGHVMGLCHNDADTCPNGGYSCCTPAPVCDRTAIGYGESRFRTVMSYSGGPRTRQWSAPPPAVWYSDGISAVGTSLTNATGCLLKTIATVAGWHATVIPVNTHTAPTTLLWAPPTHPAPTGLSWTPQ